MIKRHQFIYRGDLQAIGAFHSQCFIDCEVDGNIVAVYFDAEGVTNFTDSWYFGLKVNGTNVLLTTDRPQITAADLEVEKTGLAIPVNFRDRMVPTVDARGTGIINGPILIIIDVEPATKATPVDADTLELSDSADSKKPKLLSWANLKATLKTYFDTLYVALTGNQTIAGIKTFSSSPIVPAPTTDFQAATKKYVDDSGGYTDEQAQDAVGAMIADTATIDLTYTDATPELKADVKDDSITYAKMQNVSATSRAIGRKTAGAGDPEELTLSELLDFIGGAAQGDILFRGAAGWARLAAGVSGKFLKTQGAAADPIWATIAGGGDLLAANNLSDLASAATARTNLGLTIGTNVQAYDADLDSWATKTAPAGAAVGTTDTQTLTNKRVTARVDSSASSATPTPNADSDDVFELTALAAAAAFAAPSGTPTDGQPLLIRIKDDGTARGLTWNAIYRVIGVTLPTTTVISKTLYVGCIYNAADSKWDVLGVNQQA
jgi:hypothetical protein